MQARYLLSVTQHWQRFVRWAAHYRTWFSSVLTSSSRNGASSKPCSRYGQQPPQKVFSRTQVGHASPLPPSAAQAAELRDLFVPSAFRVPVTAQHTVRCLLSAARCRSPAQPVCSDGTADALRTERLTWGEPARPPLASPPGPAARAGSEAARSEATVGRFPRHRRRPPGPSGQPSREGRGGGRERDGRGPRAGLRRGHKDGSFPLQPSGEGNTRAEIKITRGLRGSPLPSQQGELLPTQERRLSPHRRPGDEDTRLTWAARRPCPPRWPSSIPRASETAAARPSPARPSAALGGPPRGGCVRLPPAVGPGRARLTPDPPPAAEGGEARGRTTGPAGSNARGTAPLRSRSSTCRARRARLASGARRRVTYVVAEAAFTHISRFPDRPSPFPFVGSLSVCECLSSAGLQILFFFFFLASHKSVLPQDVKSRSEPVRSSWKCFVLPLASGRVK